MKNKINNEVVVSYKSLGDFVRQKRRSLGYSSIDSFAIANGIDRTYIVRLENGNQFGSPENFVAVAKALGVTPGYMMDIFAELIDANNNPTTFDSSLNIPANFNDEDKKLLSEFISFLNYKKLIGQSHPESTPPSIPPHRHDPGPNYPAGKESAMRIHRARSKSDKNLSQKENKPELSGGDESNS